MSKPSATLVLRRNWVPIAVGIGCAAIVSSPSVKKRFFGDKNVTSAEPNKNSPEKSNILEIFDDLSKNGPKIISDLLQGKESTSKLNPKQGENGLFGFFSSVKQDEPQTEENIGTSSFASLAKTFGGIVTGQVSESEFSSMIQTAQAYTQRGDVNETKSGKELINFFLQKQEEVKSHFQNSLGHLDLTYLNPTSFFYYIEKEDAEKNPSWKRRTHRYCSGVDAKVVRGLNDALHLAEISYLDSIDEMKQELALRANDEWEMIYCQLESLPEQPSHYIAIKKGQSRWSNTLELLLVVRGTKNIPDMLTDSLMDDTDYRGGKAHTGILRAGHYLVSRHMPTFENLLDLSKKKNIKITLVGHSLGAGAAAITGMELNELDNFDVQVIGFGCPAILSFDLSVSTKKFITTVIGDADVIPRMSAETIGNLILNVMEYDWSPYAKRDIEDALRELSRRTPLFGETASEHFMGFVDSAFEKYIKDFIKQPTEKRLDTILYPPGSCVHFYRDGVSISGSYVPCNFFNEIDVSRTMINDHLITSGYRRIFLEVMRSSLADDNFRFDREEK